MTNLIGKFLTRAYSARQVLARLAAAAPARHPLAETLGKDGVLILPNALSSETVARLKAENARYFEDPARSELVYSPDGRKLLEASAASAQEIARYYFLHVKNYQDKVDVYREIVPVVAPILDAFYRSRYFVRDAYCYRTQPVPAVQGSYEWHRDNYPPGSLKVMTYLTDVLGPENGPLTVAAGTRHGFYPELGKIGDRYDAETVSGRRVVDCLGPAGTVIVFDNNSIHRATDPTVGRREVINFTVFPCVLPPNGHRPKGLDLGAEQTWLKKYTR